MSQVVVQPVASRRQRKQFLGFPWIHYRGDPYWVPPLRGSQKELVGYCHHPFYERNKVQTFLAYRAGEVCGRIAAIINYGHIERFSERRGFFGFFECVNDPEAANSLFDAARNWLGEHDIHSIRGPASPSSNYEWGLLIDGFDSSPTFLITYNPPYYAKLVEGYGFRKVQDLYSYGGNVDFLPKIQSKLGPISSQIIERFNVRLRPLDKARFLEDVQAFLDIYNRSLMGTWGFVPMTDGEMQAMAKGLRHLMVPELAWAQEIERQDGGSRLLPARLQPHDSQNRWAAVSVRRYPLVDEQAEDQEDSTHQHQRASRVPADGIGAGADARCMPARTCRRH